MMPVATAGSLVESAMVSDSVTSPIPARYSAASTGCGGTNPVALETRHEFARGGRHRVEADDDRQGHPLPEQDGPSGDRAGQDGERLPVLQLPRDRWRGGEDRSQGEDEAEHEHHEDQQLGGEDLQLGGRQGLRAGSRPGAAAGRSPTQ